METTDLVLAILHHLLAFSLAGVIGAEFVMLRNEPSPSSIRLLARIDRHYGMIAMAIIAVGIVRVVYGLKGWEFYAYNWMFWAKMAAFMAVGLLSIRPTMRFIDWNRKAAQPDFQVPGEDLAAVRSAVRMQAIVFILIPVFAALMARGYGI